jgi:hypothetical protein
MKITKSQLREIIREEIQKVKSEIISEVKKLKPNTSSKAVQRVITKIKKDWGANSDVYEELSDWMVSWYKFKDPDAPLAKPAIDAFNHIIDNYDLIEGVNENVNMDRVADLFAYYGTNPSRYNDKTVDRYGDDVVNVAKKLAPQIEKFEKTAAAFLQKIKSDKLYPIYLEMVKADKGYSGAPGHTTFSDVLGRISYKNNLK